MKTIATIAQVAFIGVAAVGVYAFVGSAQHDMRRASCTALCRMHPAYAGQEKRAPDFELTDMSGQKLKLSSLRGKVVVLNFWTKTCEPCKEEMPSVAELAKVGQSTGDFVVVTVSTDEGPAAVRDMLKVLLNGDPPFPVLFDPESSVVAGQYGTHLFPETWIIDREGIIRARFDGAKDWSSPVAVELVRKVVDGASCAVEFYKSEPLGPYAGLCDED